jgi:oxazoline/thiazoline synthase
VDDDHIAQMKAFYAEIGREFWVLDLTSDLALPVCVAISRRTADPAEDIMMGFGAHLDARIALTRALTELNQFIPALLNIAPDGATRYMMGDAEAIRWWTTAKAESEPYLRPGRDQKPRKITGTRPRSGHDVGEMLAKVIDCIEGAGHEVMVLDQSRPDIDLSVVKVIAPGLCHFGARFPPGRLYDVPVRMGKLKAPLSEDELNPTAMFL